MNAALLLIFGGGIVAMIGVVWRVWAQAMTAATIQKTEDQDKTLQQQQLENQQKLAEVNKQLQDLYNQRKQQNPNETDEERARSWDQPPKQF